MNLVNFKKIKLMVDSERLLRFFLALVFLSAGIYRVFNYDSTVLEFTNLKLPIWISFFLIIFEIGAGLGLLINKYTKQIYSSLLIFLIIILVWALILDGKKIINQAGELFAFNLNPTDLFLHFVFLLLVTALLLKKK